MYNFISTEHLNLSHSCVISQEYYTPHFTEVWGMHRNEKGSLYATLMLAYVHKR